MFRTVEERLQDGSGRPWVLYRNRAWEDRFAGLRCGITAAEPEADFGLARAGSLPRVLERYRSLAAQLGFPIVAVPRQVHGRRVVPAGPTASSHRGGGVSGESPGAAGGRGIGDAPDVILRGEADGLLWSGRGRLLAITAADCVPVYLVAPRFGALALLHAGWRGTAAGVLEAGLDALRRDHGVEPGDIHAHLGPAICGACYEVGPEVFEALGQPGVRALLDLRRVLAERAVAAGVPSLHVSISTWCTRCAADRFHSHRGMGGTAGRMAAYLGLSGE